MYTMQTSPDRKLKLCALPVCRGKRYDLVHKFPMNNERAQQWIDAINMPELNKIPLDKIRKKYFICTKHFRPQDYKNCESRSLNITAYPRLHLNDNNQESTEVCSTDPLQLQEYVLDIPTETDTNKRSILTPTTTKTESIEPVQYIVCAPSNDLPLLLKKNKINEANIMINKSAKTLSPQKPIMVKTFQSNVNCNLSAQKRQLPKVIESDDINYILEPVRKKLQFNGPKERNKPNQNEMSDETSGMIVLQHESLSSPVKVCPLWLRDHCRCDKCYGLTSQRKTNIIDIPVDIHPIDSKMENNDVHITWSDGHESSYDLLDLHDQLDFKPNTSQVKAFLWSAADIVSSNYANVTLNDYLCNDEVAKEVVASLIKFGCAFIKNVPANLQSTEIAVRRLFPIQKTIFGEMWSFSDNKAHNDTAYTNEALSPHNDNTYFNDPAGLQILHCISRCGKGGDNLLVDGFHVLNKLRQRNHDAFQQLSQISIPSEYIEDGYHFKHCAPVIILDSDTDEPTQIRFNMNDRAFFNTLPQEKMLQFYKNYITLAKEVHLDENNWCFKLEPGTVCIFDNWRLLHGRTEYSGRRNMVGCYVARSEFLSVARRYGMIN